jgi:hypothetical protein
VQAVKLVNQRGAHQRHLLQSYRMLLLPLLLPHQSTKYSKGNIVCDAVG